MDNPIIRWEDWENSSTNIEDIIAFVNTVLEECFTRDFYFAIVPTEDGIEIVFQDDTNNLKGGDKMGKVLRVTFIDVKPDAEEKITELAKEICVSEEHNLIVEELTAYVIPPKE